MAIRLYNTLTRKKENFEPLRPGKVGMYTCGPTVYSYAHIGNLRTYVFEDILRRYLEWSGYEVTHVMNITDVDDKTIEKAIAEDRDLLLERRKWAGRRDQLRKEYREALALRDRAQVNIISARIAQAGAQLELLEENLLRTRLVAPFDGIVVRGDLSQSMGSPVERGDVLFEVAPLDGFRIILEVDERDISDAAVGQRGHLTLSALPGKPLALVVERVTPVATAEDGRNFFRVDARLEQLTPALRPGMEGVAKIEVGERRLIWIWTHRLVDWLRLWIWTWLP